MIGVLGGSCNINTTKKSGTVWRCVRKHVQLEGSRKYNKGRREEHSGREKMS